jgi:mRNA interferase HigB
MRVVAISTLRAFWSNPRHADTREPLRAWYAAAEKAQWKSPADVNAQYGNAGLVCNARVHFNIGGNKYRLVVAFAYCLQVSYVKFIGRHAEYDKVDVATIDMTA